MEAKEKPSAAECWRQLTGLRKYAKVLRRVLEEEPYYNLEESSKNDLWRHVRLAIEDAKVEYLLAISRSRLSARLPARPTVLEKTFPRLVDGESRIQRGRSRLVIRAQSYDRGSVKIAVDYGSRACQILAAMDGPANSVRVDYTSTPFSRSGTSTLVEEPLWRSDRTTERLLLIRSPYVLKRPLVAGFSRSSLSFGQDGWFIFSGILEEVIHGCYLYKVRMVRARKDNDCYRTAWALRSTSRKNPDVYWAADPEILRESVMPIEMEAFHENLSQVASVG